MPCYSGGPEYTPAEKAAMAATEDTNKLNRLLCGITKELLRLNKTAKGKAVVGELVESLQNDPEFVEWKHYHDKQDMKDRRREEADLKSAEKLRLNTFNSFVATTRTMGVDVKSFVKAGVENFLMEEEIKAAAKLTGFGAKVTEKIQFFVDDRNASKKSKNVNLQRISERLHKLLPPDFLESASAVRIVKALYTYRKGHTTDDSVANEVGLTARLQRNALNRLEKAGIAFKGKTWMVGDEE